MVDTDRIYLGIQGKAYTIDPANADAAFQLAFDELALLAPQGADLYVLPGSAPYVFKRPVQLNGAHGNADNVTLHFSSGAVLDFDGDFAPQGGDPAALFVIQQRHFRCVGARVEHAALSGPLAAGRSCFLISDGAAARDSDGASFEDCHFRIAQSGADVRSFSCIRAIGLVSDDPRRGLNVSRSTFSMLAGDPQDLAWNGVEPYGVCAVRTLYSAETRVQSTRFVGDPAGPEGFGRCGPMLYFLDGGENVVSASIFRRLDLSLSQSSDPQDPPVLVRVSGLNQEGHHTVLTANIVDQVRADRLIDLQAAQFDVLVGNLFARPAGVGSAVVHAGGGSTLVLGGNAFRDEAGSLARMVNLTGIRNVTISGGVYSDLVAGKQPIRIGPGCNNVVVEPNEPRSELPGV